MRAKKGSAFEREICKRLSLWWTDGERDDVFWRSSQSGGRATLRAQKGMRTFGSYGDIAAVDPIGQPLLDVFTIELKRGSTYKVPGDLLDFGRNNRKHPWAKAMNQAFDAHVRAGSQSWLMICKRDHREIMAYLPTWKARELQVLNGQPYARFRINVRERYDFVGIPLTVFLRRADPQKIHSLAKQKL